MKCRAAGWDGGWWGGKPEHCGSLQSMKCGMQRWDMLLQWRDHGRAAQLAAHQVPHPAGRQSMAPSRMRPAPTDHRSQTHIRKAWFLRGITGEPAAVELPTQPHPRWGPESVVLAQLEALR